MAVQLTKDEILEAFIHSHVTGLPITRSIARITGREADDDIIDDYSAFNQKCEMMYRGWVSMNGRIRSLSKNK